MQLRDTWYHIPMDTPPPDIFALLKSKLTQSGFEEAKTTQLISEIFKEINIEILRLVSETLPNNKKEDLLSVARSAKSTQELDTHIQSLPGIDQQEISKRAIDNVMLKINRILSANLTPAQLDKFHSPY